MKAHFAEIAAAAADIEDDHKADAAHDDERIGDDVQQQIIPVGDQAGAAAQCVKPRIIKGSNRVKNTEPERPQRHVIPGKGRKAQHRARCLAQHRHEQDSPHELDHAVQAFDIQRLPHKRAALQADAPPGHKGQPHADGRHAQTADLDQHRDDQLAEQTEGVTGVHHDQPGDADGAGSGKKCVQRCDMHPRMHRERQHEQRRTAEDQQRKADGDDPRRGLRL